MWLIVKLKLDNTFTVLAQFIERYNWNGINKKETNGASFAESIQIFPFFNPNFDLTSLQSSKIYVFYSMSLNALPFQQQI